MVTRDVARRPSLRRRVTKALSERSVNATRRRRQRRAATYFVTINPKARPQCVSCSAIHWHSLAEARVMPHRIFRGICGQLSGTVFAVSVTP